MALKQCDECNTLMSDKAPHCLNCGYPIAAQNFSGRTSKGFRPRLAVEYATLVSVLLLIALVLTQ